MEYYIDVNNKFYEKSGIDFLIENEIQTFEGLRLATDKEVYEEFYLQNRQVAITEAIYLKNEFVNSTITVDGMEFQVDELSLKNINIAIRVIGDSDIDWKLANNEFKTISASVLELVLKEYDKRYLHAESIFLTWKSSADMEKLPKFN